MTDLQKLRNAQDIIQNFNSAEKFNQSCETEASNIKAKAKKEIEAKCKATFSEIKTKSDKVVFKDGGWIIILFLISLVALVIVAPFTFAKPFLSFSLEDYVNKCAEEVRADTPIANLYWGDRYDKIIEEENGGSSFFPDGFFGNSDEKNTLEKDRNFIQDCATFLFGNLIFTFILCFFIGIISTTLITKGKGEYDKVISFVLGMLTLISAISLLFVYYSTFSGAFGYFNQTEMWFSGIFQTVLAIPLIFATSGNIVLPIILIHAVIYASVGIYIFILKKNKEHFIKTRSVPEIKKILDDLDNFVKSKTEKANSDANLALKKRKKNPYSSEYYKLPRYLMNLSHVNALISAIERGYATDIVSANNYLDRKAFEAQQNQRLARIESQVNHAAAAAERAEAEAVAARKAAEAPLEITYYYYL